MDRRTIVQGVLAAGTSAVAETFSLAAPASPAPADAIPRVAYHLSDLDKVAFVLGNVRNHIDGMGGPDKVRIAIVVHGPPLRAFRADAPNVAIRSDTAQLRMSGVALFACRHTLEGMQLTLDALVPGFVVADKGGVVKLAELQAAGWLYLRP